MITVVWRHYGHPWALDFTSESTALTASIILVESGRTDVLVSKRDEPLPEEWVTLLLDRDRRRAYGELCEKAVRLQIALGEANARLTAERLRNREVEVTV